MYLHLYFCHSFNIHLHVHHRTFMMLACRCSYVCCVLNNSIVVYMYLLSACALTVNSECVCRPSLLHRHPPGWCAGHHSHKGCLWWHSKLDRMMWANLVYNLTLPLSLPPSPSNLSLSLSLFHLQKRHISDWKLNHRIAHVLNPIAER